MDELDLTNPEIDDDPRGYTPGEEPGGDEIIKPSDDYIPLDEDDLNPSHPTNDIPGSTTLGVTEDELDELSNKPIVDEGDKPNDEKDISEAKLGRKVCPTRHGCQGATDCDYSYGSYPY